MTDAAKPKRSIKACMFHQYRRPSGTTPHQPDILVPSMQDRADALV